MTDSMLNDMALRRRLLTEEGDIILSGDMPDGFDQRRQVAAKDGREILLDSDATYDEIAALVEDPGLDEISARLSEIGVILQPQPASYNPDQARRTEIAIWPEPEQGFLHLGVTKEADVGDVVVVAARALGHMLDLDEGKNSLADDAVLTSFSLRLAAKHGHKEAVSRRIQESVRKLQLGVVSRQPTKQEETEAGVLLWAALTALKENDRSFIRAHVQRFAPVAAWVAQRLEARIGGALPDDPAAAARTRKLIAAVLSAPELRLAEPTGAPEQPTKSEKQTS